MNTVNMAKVMRVRFTINELLQDALGRRPEDLSAKGQERWAQITEDLEQIMTKVRAMAQAAEDLQ